jgi:hypothetical protein
MLTKVWRRYKLLLSCVLFPGEDEQKLLEASMAYAAGSPIMSDAEFDQLKLKLKVGPLLPSCVCTCKDDVYIYTHFISMFADQVLCYAVPSPSLDRRQCHCDGGSQVQSKES